ncbi:RNA-directed DNA polymerase [Pseudoalteromonas pernae]|uniref:RNA-directed DNA polymerase n=1 Tax=Pseudoalteromonas pernae TaxID=3118054 RepID=UPI003241D35F
MSNPIKEHRKATKRLARSLKKTDVYHWLCERGYFPESYVLPPCFVVDKRPTKPKVYTKVTGGGKKYKVPRTECLNVHFPKTEYTDRNFGLIHPEIHNDIAYHISTNWLTIVEKMVPKNSQVTSYTFPIPIDSRTPGRVGYLRSGRLIYEFIGMIDDDIASEAYKYRYIVKADIKSFYPSIYTHSIAWAIHGKKFIRKPVNMHNYKLLGNRLDRLFQNANDGCTNGVPIGPVVSDVIAEIVASAVDVNFTKLVRDSGVECEAVRFKDDYRILTKSESDSKRIIKFLQASLKEYSLELSDEKTTISPLPDGLFREWVSKYHAVHPVKKKSYTWKEFRELYLATIRIDKECTGTGVIERFLADIVDKNGKLKITVGDFNLQKVISMLIMLGSLRIKAFPKIIAILEGVLKSDFGFIHQDTIVEYLEDYLITLSEEEERNKYLISWISYFLVSNGLDKLLSTKPKYKDPITRSILNNRGNVFKDCKEHKIFVGCKTIAKKVTMIEHLDVFNPPKIT